MSDPLKDVLLRVESSLRAKQLKVDTPIVAVERALAAYKQAVHGALAAEFSREHRLKSSPPSAPDPAKLAQDLLLTVQALPELGLTDRPRRATQVLPAPSEEVLVKLPPGSARAAAPAIPDSLPLVGAALTRGPVVIVGGLMRQDRLARLPKALVSKIEWIDTNRGGSHAIGNLAQRIRQNRVAALIIIDGQVSHKHTDPVLAAAREVNVPAAYAGKGGQNALLRAVLELEKMLRHGT